MTAGGQRPGSGRKAGYRKEGAARELLAVRLTDDERRQAEALGDGNASEGIRLALQLWADSVRWHSPEAARARLAAFVAAEREMPAL